MLDTPRRIVVTGGAGFIGSHLVDRLLAGGHQVLCVDDFNDFYNPGVKWANIDPHRDNPRFLLAPADIRDRETIRPFIISYHPDIIVHLAARAGVRPSLTDPFLYHEVNTTGTLHLLDAAVAARVKKFVFGSSSSVYGINEKVPFSEEDPLLTPISPYAATKLAGEALCHSFAHLHRMPTVTLRFFTVYGPRQRPDLAIHKFARLILGGRPVPVFGDGTTRRDYTYIDDIIAGTLAAIDYESDPYEVFNLGNSRTVELRELIRLLEEVLGENALVDLQPLQPGDVPRTWADIKKAERLLGFRPATPIREGLAKFAEWLQNTTPETPPLGPRSV
ncbi:MAG: GDP-mannose 4,6-dehydratase [Candidatus Desulforudis sp.]|nr:GDP-mannose 4,6-dehydratase [Desulforudis sp.]